MYVFEVDHNQNFKNEDLIVLYKMNYIYNCRLYIYIYDIINMYFIGNLNDSSICIF